MQKTKPVIHHEISEKICDKCQLSATKENTELYEFVSIDRTVGYGSVFGDGNRIEIDLCQGCFKELLGRFVRVSHPEVRTGN